MRVPDEMDQKDKDKKEAPADMGAHQGVAVLGIALIAMGEEIGAEMALRTFGHLLRYGEPTLRRAVPLALALISVSNPRLNIRNYPDVMLLIPAERPQVLAKLTGS